MKKIVLFFILSNLNLIQAQPIEVNSVVNQAQNEIQNQNVNSLSEISPSQFEINGVALEKGTLNSLKEITVFLLPLKIKTLTNSKGEFKFEKIPAGQYQIVINLSGYKRFEKTIEAQLLSSTKQTEPTDKINSNLKPNKFYIEKETYLSFETTVVGQKQKRDQSQKTLTQEQFLSLPGSGGDPVKAVQNLPGVNRVQGFSSQVVIQGGEPKDTKYNIDGHNIPIVFHFGGLTSVVMPEALEQVDYLSAGYGSDFSRATGGIINLKTRTPDSGDRNKKSFFFMDNLKLGALYESNLDEKSSFLVSGRISYVGLFLKQIAKDRDDFNLTVAPEFMDLTSIYKNKLNDTDDFKLVALASKDTLSFVLNEPLKTDPAFRGKFYNLTQFYRFVPQWSRKLDSNNTIKVSAGLGQNETLVDIGDQYFKLNSSVLTFRSEWDHLFSNQWNSQLGVDNGYGQAEVKIRLVQPRSEGGISNPFSASEIKERNISAKITNIGLYNRHEVTFQDWTLVPSIRFDRFKDVNQNLLSPRLATKCTYNDSLIYKAATGLYYQPPEPQETDKVFGNPDIKSPHAVHLTFGLEKDFRNGNNNGFTFQTQYFDKWLDQLVVQSSGNVTRDGVLVAENYNNSGKGRAYGVENQIKWNDQNWDLWLSYTWSESFRWNDLVAKYKHQYDQTHNLNIVAAKKLNNNWKASGRFRFVTGNPFTPVIDSQFDVDSDVYTPQRGQLYSERFKDFYQLDLRIDKKWILDDEIWTFYLDIQNVLNTKNPESIEYSYNYKEKDYVSGLPFLPAFGIKGEF